MTHMAKMLTQAGIDAIGPSDRRREVADGKIGGLYFVIQPSGSGARSWALRYRLAGRNRKLTIGPYPLIDIATARARATKAKALIVDGIDPAAQKQEAKAAARAKAAEKEPDDLIETVAQIFIERYAKTSTRRRSWREAERILAHDILPKWGKRRLSTITKADTHRLLDGVLDRDAKVMANRVLITLKSMSRWARERGIIEQNPFDQLRPPATETPRDRILNDREIRVLMAALETEPYPLGPVTKLLLLTGARRSEIGEMRWSEIDLDAKVWTLPKERSKNKRQHQLPLSDAIIDILQGLPRICSSDLVFTLNGVVPASAFSRTGRRIYNAMEAALGDEVPPWSFHDLRRTAASGMASLGIGPHIVEAVLNHKSGTIRGVASVYNKYQYQPEQRAALERWAAHVEALASGEAAENVIEFAKAKA